MLALEQTGHTWTLEAENGRSYQVGNRHDCDVFLPYVNFASDVNLELSYDSLWYVRDLGSLNGALLNKVRLNQERIPIEEEARISFGGGMVIVARLDSSPIPSRKPDALIAPTRLLSGYVYLEGLTQALEILNQLRSDPYKATTPEDPSLDLDQVTTHAAQSVVISLTFASLALIIFLLEYLLILAPQAKFDLMAWLIVGIFPSFLIAFESIYLRWFMARRFLRKKYEDPYYYPKWLPKFFKNAVNLLKNSIVKTAQLQNIITFAGSNPFIGSGEIIPGSSWTVPITRKKKHQEKSEEWENSQEYIEIAVDQFYQATDREIDKLNLPNLEILSRLYIDGFELEPDGKLLMNTTSRPAVMFLDDPLLIKEQGDVAGKKRAYRIYRYVDQERDYILSYFLRFYNAGKVTFVESSAYILTGIDRQRFSLSSLLEDSPLSRTLKMLLGTIIFASGIYLGLSLWYVVVFSFYLFYWKFNDARQRRAAEFQEEYNYGLEQTFREFIAEPLDLSQRARRQQTVNLAKNPLSRSIKNFINQLRRTPLGILILIILILAFSPLFIILAIFTFFANPYRQLNTDLKVSFDYYGTQDVLMYWKSIQNGIFSSTIKLLKSQGIDSSEFERSVISIINNVTRITAGNITNSQIAVGSGSTFSQSTGTSQTQSS
ncbi:MAG: FHA domain-containing protein [Microcystis sp.]|uniref:FHA domain-containing protein n=1 Tax=Microcystis sp. TaxID=1127 RepID=UPI00391DEC6A